MIRRKMCRYYKYDTSCPDEEDFLELHMRLNVVVNDLVLGDWVIGMSR